MPVRYCLGIQHNDVAGAIDPGAGPFHLDPLREQLKRLVPELTFGELQHVPSFAWTNKKLATHVLTQLRFTGHDEAQRFHEALEKRLAAPDRKPIYGFGPDPPIHALEAWSPIGSGGGIFSDRDRAERLAGAAGLRDKYNQPVTGKGVNVVIADRGLSRSVVQATTDRMAARRGLQQAARQRVLGWTRHDRTGSADDPEPRYINPGRCGSDHGYMIARNVLAIAPDAIIWDAPLLPSDDEPDAPPGPSSASQLFQFIKDALKTGKDHQLGLLGAEARDGGLRRTGGAGECLGGHGPRVGSRPRGSTTEVRRQPAELSGQRHEPARGAGDRHSLCSRQLRGALS
jgi:hypothetical protein